MTSALIKQEALRLGFDACGICKAEFTGEHAVYLQKWIDNGYNGEMDYMKNNVEKRSNTRLLVENAKSVIVTALNYYPKKTQNPENPQFSYHAYGKDYHIVVKEKLKQLYEYINREIFPVTGRFFCDTAPLLEKYNAQKSGLGWIGKNTQLIIPGKGSFFFLGEIIIDKELDYDIPQTNKCGNCQKCVDACPVNALIAPFQLDARRCISYLTIEDKSELSRPLPNNIIYGCDICNKVCPHNQLATPTKIIEFHPSDQFLNLDKNAILAMDEKSFHKIFKDSPVKRIGLAHLKSAISK